MDYAKRLAAELSAPETCVAAAIALIDEGNTIPFIARYRKEATGAWTTSPSAWARASPPLV